MQRPHMWIKLPNQDEIDCETITEGLKFLQDDSDLSITNTYLDSAGIEGSVLERQTYSKTAVNANFWLHFGSWYDYKLAKHDIARVFGQKGLMRIRTDAEPYIVKYMQRHIRLSRLATFIMTLFLRLHLITPVVSSTRCIAVMSLPTTRMASSLA